jgi:hypothetical protein
MKRLPSSLEQVDVLMDANIWASFCRYGVGIPANSSPRSTSTRTRKAKKGAITMTVHPLRLRASEEVGPGTKLGQYALAAASGQVTTIAAGTAAAGHLFAFRNTHASTKVYLRYVAAQFILGTAFGTAQEVGCDLITTRTYSASHTAGTAIDVGGTNANANKLRSLTPTSCLATGDARVATAAALTNGTHTIDPNPVSMVSGWAGAVGPIIGRYPGTGITGGLLYDARDDYSPIVLGTNEGFLIRNTVLMGATGVGRWLFWVEWDEGTAA